MVALVLKVWSSNEHGFPGNLLDIQILRLYPKPSDWKTLRNLFCKSPSGDSYAGWNVRATELMTVHFCTCSLQPASTPCPLPSVPHPPLSYIHTVPGVQGTWVILFFFLFFQFLKKMLWVYSTCTHLWATWDVLIPACNVKSAPHAEWGIHPLKQLSFVLQTIQLHSLSYFLNVQLRYYWL